MRETTIVLSADGRYKARGAIFIGVAGSNKTEKIVFKCDAFAEYADASFFIVFSTRYGKNKEPLQYVNGQLEYVITRYSILSPGLNRIQIHAEDPDTSDDILWVSDTITCRCGDKIDTDSNINFRDLEQVYHEVQTKAEQAEKAVECLNSPEVEVAVVASGSEATGEWDTSGDKPVLRLSIPAASGEVGLPEGGTAGQVLTRTETGYEWQDVPDVDDGDDDTVVDGENVVFGDLSGAVVENETLIIGEGV